MSKFIIDDVEMELERECQNGDSEYILVTCTLDIDCERQEPDPNTWASDIDFYGYEEAELASISNIKIKDSDNNISVDDAKELIDQTLRNDKERLIEEVEKYSESLAPDPEDAPRSSSKRKMRI